MVYASLHLTQICVKFQVCTKVLQLAASCQSICNSRFACPARVSSPGVCQGAGPAQPLFLRLRVLKISHRPVRLTGDSEPYEHSDFHEPNVGGLDCMRRYRLILQLTETSALKSSPYKVFLPSICQFYTPYVGSSYLCCTLQSREICLILILDSKCLQKVTCYTFTSQYLAS